LWRTRHLYAVTVRFCLGAILPSGDGSEKEDAMALAFYHRLRRISMNTVLLIDNNQRHAESVCGRLRFHALEVHICPDPDRAITRLRRSSANYEVVIVDVSNASLPWFDTVARLQEACFQTGVYPSPRLLCTSNTKRTPDFELRIEQIGARYVYEG
jgi:hypothetical protein